MKLYHGSDHIIKKPQYGVGNPHNDYGIGFYCTQNLELAKEWACPEARTGFANSYDLDVRDLKILDLQSADFHILNWIALLLKNRIFVKKSPVSRMAEKYILDNFLPETENYDLIIGYRADDSYFAYAKDFLNNTISVSQLEAAMRLGNLGTQVVLKSENAFERVEFRDYEIANAEIYYLKRMHRETLARENYLKDHGKSLEAIQEELYVLDIIRSEVKNDDMRLFRTICK